MKTKRRAKWEQKLTLKEIKHLRENSDGTLKSVKKNFEGQAKIRLQSRESGLGIEPCWTCRFIEAKLFGGK